MYFVITHFASGSVCAVRPNVSIHTVSIRSTGHLFDAVVVDGREEVENRFNDGIQLRMSLTEHDENDVDEEGILFELIR
jgi:hypothetical protein